MKRLVMIVCLLTAVWGAVWSEAGAQCTAGKSETCTKPFTRKWYFGANVGAGLPQHDVTPVFGGVNVGYEFAPRLYAFARAEVNTGLYEKDGERAWNSAGNLGAGLGFRLLGAKGCCGSRGVKDCLDLRAMAGSSIGHADWKQTFYDAGLEYYFRGREFGCTPTIGLGYRYVDSRTTGLRNYSSVYMTIGFRF